MLLVYGEFVHTVVDLLVVVHRIVSPQVVVFRLAMLFESDAALLTALQQLMVLFLSNIHAKVQTLIPFGWWVQLHTIRLSAAVA